MPVLADFVYPQGAKFACQRQYIVGFAIGWQLGSYATAYGIETHLTEVLFGGYRLVIRWKSWIWNWDNRGFYLDELFQDYYVLPPGSSTPASAGTVYVLWDFDPTYKTVIIKIINPAPGDWYLFQRFPEADRPYWLVPPDNMPATPFWYPPYTPV
jgi:hypothetical protein